MKHYPALLAAGILALAGLATPASAHGPARLKTEQSVLLAAPVTEVWQVVGDFSDMSWYPGSGAITVTGEGKGATRTREIAGRTVTEELMRHDAAKHAISTRLVADDLAVVKASNYASHITLKDEGGRTRVDWKGAFYRGFPQNEPPADLDDAASTASVEAHHQAGLDALAARFGKAD